MFLVFATIHLGNGFTKKVSDLVVDCHSKKAAKQKYFLFLKKELPKWQRVVKITVS